MQALVSPVPIAGRSKRAICPNRGADCYACGGHGVVCAGIGDGGSLGPTTWRGGRAGQRFDGVRRISVRYRHAIRQRVCLRHSVQCRRWPVKRHCRSAVYLFGRFLGSLDLHWWADLPGIGAVSLAERLGYPAAVGLQVLLLATIWLILKQLGFTARTNIWRPGVFAWPNLMRGPWPLAWAALLLAILNWLSLLVAGHPWSITWAFALWVAKFGRGSWLGSGNECVLVGRFSTRRPGPVRSARHDVYYELSELLPARHWRRLWPVE